MRLVVFFNAVNLILPKQVKTVSKHELTHNGLWYAVDD
jgi:hypothetical protein